MDSALPRTLRELRDALDGFPRGVADGDLERARDRLDRDLLPRTAARDGALVAGIVGPNNAGKSALFNALVGRAVSPSLPTGGATRRLVGAARGDLAGALRALDGWQRFRLVDFDPALDASLPTELPPAAAELLLVESNAVPADVLLIDTPDFDSVMRENRASSEALLAVADVALVVVTRHTYQNAALVDYMRSWLEHGRPWILVYNEAPSAEIALEHADKLSLDVGTPPLEVFHAPTDLRVMEGEAPLEPRAAGRADGPTLATHLADLRSLSQLKAAALQASLSQLAGDLDALVVAAEERAEAAASVHAHAHQAARDVGFRVAGEAMPAGPFLAAFREVLDRRSNRFSRRWRSGMGALRVRMEMLPKVLGVRRGSKDGERPHGLEKAELPVLERAWPAFFETLARDLGPEHRAEARRDCPAGLAAKLDEDLGRSSAEGLARARAAVVALPVELEGFQATCEELVERALEDRGTDLDIQALADLATVLPVAFAAVLIVKTGGFAADLGVAGGSMATSFLLDKYKHVLGSSVTREARRRWQEERGALLGRAVYGAALPVAGEPLERASSADVKLAEFLRGGASAVRVAAAEAARTDRTPEATP